MYLARLTKHALSMSARYSFASAASVDYYKLLNIHKNSTTDQIHEAYAQITKKINPDNDPFTFNKISEAFVILTDNKARDAYDSLLKSYKVTYINQQQVKEPSTRSYLAERKANRQKDYSKKYNIDSFGRYRGGVPKPGTKARGKSLGQIGQMYKLRQIEDQDSFPDYLAVDEYRAESFKNFHQNQRESRTMKRPWISLEVDYDFFSIYRFMKGGRNLQIAILLSILLPIIFQSFMAFRKQEGANKIKSIRQAKIAEQARKAQEARLAEEAKLAEEQKTAESQ